MKHELLLTNEAATYFSAQGQTQQQVLRNMALVADQICAAKGWTVGINAMVVIREAVTSGSTGLKPWFVINQVLDTHKAAVSDPDLNRNTPSLNRHAHCILTARKNGPNRYGGFTRLVAQARNGNLAQRIV